MDVLGPLKVAYNASGWSLAELAVASEMSVASVTAWLNGRQTPNGRVIALLQAQLPGFRDLLATETERYLSTRSRAA
jgi:transcriptional regulator with XRE-family HTH domain